MSEDKIILTLKDTNIQSLCAADTILGKLIYSIGDIEIDLRTNYFHALVRAIISQQVSVKAASTIFARLEQLVNHEITPHTLVTIDDDKLKQCGISKQKLSYIRDLTEKFSNINTNELKRLSNNEIITILTNVKGIGKWTAEMFLLFSLGRLDILPLDDVGLQRACKWLYKIEDEISGKNALKAKSVNWTDVESIASLYLWEAINKEYLLTYKSIEELAN